MSTLYVDNIYSKTGTAQAIDIDSSGRVQNPKRPYIMLIANAQQTVSANTAYTGWRVDGQRDITYSSGVITVPVDGLYRIGVSIINQGTGGYYLRINGTAKYRIGYGNAGTGETWSQQGGDGVFELNAGDTVDFAPETSLITFGGTTYTAVGGAYLYLLG